MDRGGATRTPRGNHIKKTSETGSQTPLRHTLVFPEVCSSLGLFPRYQGSPGTRRPRSQSLGSGAHVGGRQRGCLGDAAGPMHTEDGGCRHQRRHSYPVWPSLAPAASPQVAPEAAAEGPALTLVFRVTRWQPKSPRGSHWGSHLFWGQVGEEDKAAGDEMGKKTNIHWAGCARLPATSTRLHWASSHGAPQVATAGQTSQREGAMRSGRGSMEGKGP